ncbi:hypothetical protein JHK82_031165 [Glycine max]|nr:hypothetical protein JHK85_031812 [Glycine max]KAG4994432.1 hypothetical protein JHK86_031259 [Glycine max]KAG5124428.1 hypothetical protein JHK82_031165 [Glycine max]KAG5145854.1 hypothetical protein JHK84_031397 [Glycine max]
MEVFARRKRFKVIVRVLARKKESTEDTNFSDDEVSAPNNLDFSNSPIPHNYDKEQLFGCQGHKGFLKIGLANQNLTVQVPKSA